MTRTAYICGGYTAPTDAARRANIRKALEAGLIMLDQGYFPLVPHASMNHETDWETALQRCENVIHSLDPRTDCLITLDGWQSSKGCIREVALADAIGLPVRTLGPVTREEIDRALEKRHCAI